ncbi:MULTISPECIES: GNAT family N-acetyltransferase [Falsihalocynthiibacter]|uniref:GNAT family N-acetyltransferase n=1 Tax=Falsihalocynthiibacter TaxID=2854182 RepID=UPI00300154BF
MTVDYYAVAEATWRSASSQTLGGFVVRNGAGGGKRVSAATLDAPLEHAEISVAQAEMIAIQQLPLFMIRDGENDLDIALGALGYTVIDPVTIYMSDVESLKESLPRLTCFSMFPPLAIMTEIWADAGIGPERIAVMERVTTPKTTLLGRANNHAAGVAFVGIHEKTAMLHSLEVKQSLRRQGVALNIMRAAANWAQDHGAERLSIIVTQANKAGNALYTSLGMKPVGHYHYRILAPKRA